MYQLFRKDNPSSNAYVDGAGKSFATLEAAAEYAGQAWCSKYYQGEVLVLETTTDRFGNTESTLTPMKLVPAGGARLVRA